MTISLRQMDGRSSKVRRKERQAEAMARTMEACHARHGTAAKDSYLPHSANRATRFRSLNSIK